EAGYYTQEFLAKNLKIGEESFFVKDWIQQFGKGKPEVPLTKDMQEAVCELFGKLRNANTVFDDCKWDNLYIRRIKEGMKLSDGKVVAKGSPLIGKLEAGVADLDRIAYWGALNESTNQLNATLGLMETAPERLGINSIRGNRQMDPYARD